jgi:DNA-binding NarL/FixJ family response regulator
VVKVQTLVASSHNKFRRDLTRCLQLLDPRIEVVCEAATGFDALVSSNELRPELALLDLNLWPGKALDLVSHIHRLSPDTAVVVIGTESDADYRQAAIDAGALDYVDVLELTTMLPSTLEKVDRFIRRREQWRSTSDLAFVDGPPGHAVHPSIEAIPEQKSTS